jgi:hypothetical protein
MTTLEKLELIDAEIATKRDHLAALDNGRYRFGAGKLATTRDAIRAVRTELKILEAERKAAKLVR